MARTLCFLIGVTTLCFVPTLVDTQHLLILLVLAITLLIPHSLRRDKSCADPIGLHHVRICFALGLLGFIYSQYTAQQQLGTRLDPALDRSDRVITGRVVSLVEQIPLSRSLNRPVASQFYQRFLFQLDQPPSAVNVNTPLPQRVLLNNYQPQAIASGIKPGQRWQLAVRLKLPRGSSNPGGFDYPKYLLSQRIDATGYIRISPAPVQLVQARPGFSDKLWGWVTQLRAARIAALGPQLATLRHGDLLTALLLGDRSQLGEQKRRLLQRTGTAHLLAISGLHIGIAALFAAMLVNTILKCVPRLMLIQPRAIICIAAALPMASFYAVIAGLAISTQRALLMLFCLAILLLLRRNSAAFGTLLSAALIIVLINPLAVLKAGFWFSMTAVATLITVAISMRYRQQRHLAQNQKAWHQKLREIIEKFRLFLFAQLGLFITMPLVLSAFSGQASSVAPLANALAIPVISIGVVPLGISALLGSYLSIELAGYLLHASHYCLDITLRSLTLLDKVFNTTVASIIKGVDLNALQLPLSPLSFGLVMVSALILLGRAAVPGYAAAALIWFIVVNPFGLRFKPIESLGDNETLRLTQFYVGQGSAFLLQTQNYQLLYDTGPAYSAFSNAASRSIKPFLFAHRIDTIDTVIISHGDNDHAGGAAYINSNWSVGHWLLGGRAQQLKLVSPSADCHAGQTWQRNNLRFSIVSPEIEPAFFHHKPSERNKRKPNENDQSCVLQVSPVQPGRSYLLLTGDIGKRVEAKLASTKANTLASQLLAVPHHGSNSLSSIALLAAVQPDIALVSLAYRNRYRHPHPDVLERYLDRDIPLYRSDPLGAIQFRWEKNQWQGPYCARYKAQHFWQRFDNRDICLASLKLPRR